MVFIAEWIHSLFGARLFFVAAGTAKGGIVFTIADQLPIPIRYIGIGEGIEDLRPFDAEAFVQALFQDTLAYNTVDNFSKSDWK